MGKRANKRLALKDRELPPRKVKHVKGGLLVSTYGRPTLAQGTGNVRKLQEEEGIFYF